MPRMSKKLKKELAFFLNDRGRRIMIASTPLPPCMPLPKAMLRLPVSNTAKVMYARLLDEILTKGTEDSNGILFIRFPVMEIAAALSRSPQTCKRSLNELEQAGMIMAGGGISLLGTTLIPLLSGLF